MSKYFWKTFFMYARSLPVQKKVHFKTLQFLTVAYDKSFKVVFSTLTKRQCCFPLFKQFLDTEMTWSHPIIVRECTFKNQNLRLASC